ncbi:MAG: hypothetical protein AB7I30_13005, partial [Isosphaeraceae bacterium]
MSRRDPSGADRDVRPSSKRRRRSLLGVEGLETRALLSTLTLGDLNGDARVTPFEARLFRRALTRGWFPAIPAHLGNLDQDGGITIRDWRPLWRWIGREAPIRPSWLSASLDSVSDPDQDGRASRADTTLVGRTFPFARIVADLNGDGFFETRARADRHGRFHVPLTLHPGETLVRLRALSPRGHRIGKDFRFYLDVDAVAPVVTIDSPASGLLTGSPVTVLGRVVDEGTGVRELLARVDSSPPVTVPFDAATGAFQFPVALARDGSADGPHVVVFHGVDRSGNVGASVEIRFTLDTTPPLTPTLELDPASDSAPRGDGQTTESVVTLVGLSEPGVTITLTPGGRTTRTDAAGQFRFDGIALVLGTNTFQATASDALHRSTTTTATIVRLTTNTIPAPVDGEIVLAWNDRALEVIRREVTPPPVAARSLAITQAAVFDAINAVQGSRGYLVSASASAGASLQSAAYAAAHQALTRLFPGQVDWLDAALADSRASVPAGTARDDGEATGRAVADAILAQRASDGWANFEDYVPSSSAGRWMPTAPTFAPALLPHWGDVTP